MVLRIFSAAAIVAALVWGCTSVERDNPLDEKGNNYAGALASESSSSWRAEPMSGSSSSDLSYGSYTVNSISDYRIVTIGSQVWMAENLNYYVPGSYCQSNNPSNCEKYGRLYDWATAMALPSSCNFSSCSWQINDKHQGICPTGWHIPTHNEWGTLRNYIENDKSCSGCYEKHLKATSGWNDYEENGLDTYGFAALPSYGSTLWVAEEWNGGSCAGYQIFYEFSTECSMPIDSNKTYLHGVRCLRDNGSDIYQSSSSSSSMPSSSSSAPPPYISNYQTVTIGTQVWMAENLNYNVAGSECYNNQDSYCETYGRLYDWATAMNLPNSCNSSYCSEQIQEKHQGICPTGWHIPTYEEWNTLSSYVQNDSGCSDCDGRLLKATYLWCNSGNGTDAYGFAALPGGEVFSDGSFHNECTLGSWWSASEDSDGYAYYRSMYLDEGAIWGRYDMTYLRSVRCVMD